MPFQKRYKALDFTFLFTDGFRTPTKNAFKFLRIPPYFGAVIRNSHTNK